MADDRRRVWACIVYGDSAPANWVGIIDSWHIPAAISPLHDRDVWTDEDEQEDPSHVAGEFKKPHWHVMFYFDSVKSYSQVFRLLSRLGVNKIEEVLSTRGYNRYLCHIDNPEKAQYDPDDVRLLGGAKYDISTPPPSIDEQMDIQGDILDFMRKHSVTEYAELVFWCRDNGKDDWRWYLTTHPNLWGTLMKSYRHGCQHD